MSNTLAILLAMFFVIVIHATSYIKGDPFDNYGTEAFFMTVSSCCVPLFVMISGAIFLDPDRCITIKKIYTKYILRIAIAYVVWSFLYAVYHSNILFERSFNNLYVFVVHWAKGNFHLWYLWMLAGLYILVPVLRQIAKNRKILLYLIAVCFLLCSVPQFIDKIIVIKPIQIAFETNLSGIVNGYLLLNPSMYVGYFAAGYYFSKWEGNRLTQNNKLFGMFLIIYIAVVVTINICASVKAGENKNYCDYTMPLQVVMSFGIFLFVKNIHICKGKKIIAFLSGCSFGVYLIHPFAQSALNKMGLLNLPMSFAMNVLVVSIASLILSVIVTLVIKKIPLANKYLV